jgi:hypothetical protein
MGKYPTATRGPMEPGYTKSVDNSLAVLECGDVLDAAFHTQHLHQRSGACIRTPHQLLGLRTACK